MSGRYVSLFSGIGGLDLAVEAFFGYAPAAFVEWDDSCQRVLRERFPGVPVFGDIKQFGAASLPDPSRQRHGGGQDGGAVGRVDGEDASRARQWQRARTEPGDRGGSVDLVCGGFPCQPASHAGKRQGTDDERWLWPEFARVVGELRPRHVLVENVAGLLTVNGGRAFSEVVGDLASMGYDATWGSIRASDTGAPHRRERIFLLAADASGEGLQGHAGDGARGDEPRRQRPRQDGPSTEADLLAAADTERGRRQQRHTGERDIEQPDQDRLRGFTWGAYEPAVRRWERVMGPAPHPVDERNRLDPEFVGWMMGFPAGWNASESRTQRLKQFGNAVVPQQAMLAIATLAEAV